MGDGQARPRTAAAPQAPLPPGEHRNNLVAASPGNTLEWDDWNVYALMRDRVSSGDVMAPTSTGRTVGTADTPDAVTAAVGATVDTTVPAAKADTASGGAVGACTAVGTGGLAAGQTDEEVSAGTGAVTGTAAVTETTGTAAVAGTPAEQAVAEITRLRHRIDAIDGEIMRLVEERLEHSRAVQRARTGIGRPRTELAREQQIIARYQHRMGRPGVALAALLLEMCRGPLHLGGTVPAAPDTARERA